MTLLCAIIWTMALVFGIKRKSLMEVVITLYLAITYWTAYKAGEPVSSFATTLAIIKLVILTIDLQINKERYE